MKQIAFVGMGNMGLPMAGNLAKKFSVRCFDISRPARNRAAKAGLAVAASVKDAVHNANMVITMLPAGEHVREFYCGKNGALALVAKDTLLLDCSTTAPEQAQDMFAVAKQSKVRFADAPVSGGIGGARAATLSFLVGGDKALFNLARPALSAMGANIFHAGKTGAGQAAKICNNMMLSIQMVGACEALLLGKKMGLDGKTLSEIMRKSSGGNWVLEKYNPLPGVMPAAPAANKYKGGFASDLMSKDSDLAMQAARNANAATPLGALANQLYRIHIQSGGSGLDFSSILKFLAK